MIGADLCLSKGLVPRLGRWRDKRRLSCLVLARDHWARHSRGSRDGGSGLLEIGDVLLVVEHCLPRTAH